MPTFETSRGGRIDIAIPATSWKPLEAARQAYVDLLQERRVTSSHLGSLQRQRDQAIEQDRLALAKAIRSRKADPGDAAVSTIDKQITAANRRLEALEVALNDAERDLIEVIDEHRDTWAQEADAQVAAACAEYEAAIEALESTRWAMSAKRGLASWIKNFPDQLSYRPQVPGVRKLTALHGDPYRFEQVIDALREDAQPPAPKESTFIPWGQATLAPVPKE